MEELVAGFKILISFKNSAQYSKWNNIKIKVLTYTPRGYIMNLMEKAIKNKTLQRLKILEGQIRGLQKMLNDNKYCIDVLYQSSAIKQSLSSIEDLILKNHLSTCVIKQIKSEKEQKTIKEIMAVYKLSKNK